MKSFRMLLAALAAAVGLSAVPAFALTAFDNVNGQYNFGDVSVGDTSSKVITVTAYGYTSLESPQSISIYLEGSSVFTAPSSSVICYGTATCSIDVSFSPLSTGSFSDYLNWSVTFNSIYGSLPPVIGTVFLSGSGVAPTGSGVSPVPLPASFPLMLTGLIGLAGLWVRKKRALQV